MVCAAVLFELFFSVHSLARSALYPLLSTSSDISNSSLNGIKPSLLSK